MRHEDNSREQISGNAMIVLIHASKEMVELMMCSILSVENKRTVPRSRRGSKATDSLRRRRGKRKVSNSPGI